VIDQQRAGAPFLDEPDPAQDEGAHHDFAEFGRADHERADMRGIEGKRRAALRSGAAGRQRTAAGELAHLAAELTLAERDHRRHAMKPVAAADDHAAFQNQPRRGIADAHVVDERARREGLGLSAREPRRAFHLHGIEDREHLFETGVDQTHIIKLLAGAYSGSFRRAKQLTDRYHSVRVKRA
jgi:hypothetical protein